MRADPPILRHRRLALRACALVTSAGLIPFLALGLARARVAVGCSVYGTPGSHSLALRVAGRQRFVLVHVPRAIRAGERLPLVLALHGYGGSGPEMERYSGFSRVADRRGFVVAYPSSDGLAWNATGAAGQSGDIAFLERTIADLQRSGCIDPARVLATGVSNGGGMVVLAGCELSSEIAAIAPVAGGYDGQPRCQPRRPLSVLEVHGTADQVVPYFGRGRRPAPDGLPPFVNGWVHRDRCSPRAIVNQLAPRTTTYLWRRCAAGVRVEHIRIRAGRHQWPGATPPDPGPRSTFCAACTIWSFFSSLRADARSGPSRHADLRSGVA